MKVSCLGPDGSYSVLASERTCRGAELILCRNFPEVLARLIEGEADCAVIPIENSIQGGVLQNLDLLEQSAVFAVEECVLAIDHRLVTKKGVPMQNIKKIYSHEQAIGQCSDYLQKHFPNAQLLFADSTAKSLQMLNEQTAGIVGGHVQGEGLTLSDESISNEKNNFTRFLRLVRAGVTATRSEKLFCCLGLKHRPGALLRLLQIFADENINLTRIESRPIKDVFGEYRFFIEFKGDISTAVVQDVLKRVEEESINFRLLGAY